jgi:hypothetical protein
MKKISSKIVSKTSSLLKHIYFIYEMLLTSLLKLLANLTHYELFNIIMLNYAKK